MQIELNKMESSLSEISGDVSSLHQSAGVVVVEPDQVTQQLVQVKSKCEALHSRVVTSTAKFQVLTESYPSFVG